VIVSAQPERPTTPLWVYVVGLGLLAVFGWWLLGAIVGIVGWLFRTGITVLVVGLVIYGVLALIGRAPGRNR
jgi:hypothetical protein